MKVETKIQREKCEPNPYDKHLSFRINILIILAKRGLGNTVWGEDEAILGDFSPLGQGFTCSCKRKGKGKLS